jgi:hypothetical protein
MSIALSFFAFLLIGFFFAILRFNDQVTKFSKLIETLKASTDFSAEDKTVLEGTDELRKAKQRIPHPPE